MREAVIIDAVRSPRGKRNGSLSSIHPVDLAAHTLQALITRTNIDPKEIEDVILGCVTQTAEQGWNIARGAVLTAGFPQEVAGTTVNRFCGSGLQAVNYAAQAIQAETMDIVIGGGVEHMTRVPMGSDSVGGEGVVSKQMAQRWPNLVGQGISAEMIAAKYGYTRAQVDHFAARSQSLAAQAQSEGRFDREIAPIDVIINNEAKTFKHDEHARAGTTAEKLGMLKPAFKPDGILHAGNSSGIVDGSAAVLVMSKARARGMRLKARAKIVAMAIAGSDPILMLTGPIPSTQKALSQAGLTINDIDLFEINEAFAPIPMMVAQEFHIPMDRINVNGGAIALGHPLGATGAMLIATALHELERQDKRRALITLCIGYGMGITTIIDRKIDS